MVVVINANRYRWGWRPGLLAALLLLAGLAAIASYEIIAHRITPAKEWTVAQLAQAVTEGQVTRLSLSNQRMLVETRAGLRALVRNTSGVSGIDLLKELGVAASQLNEIEIVAGESAPRAGPGLLSVGLCSVPIVVLVLGIGGVLFFRARRS
jgi:hypothetical protein